MNIELKFKNGDSPAHREIAHKVMEAVKSCLAECDLAYDPIYSVREVKSDVKFVTFPEGTQISGYYDYTDTEFQLTTVVHKD